MRWLKIICWTLLSVVLLAVGTAVCAVRLLTPEQLTPITRAIANRALDAEVSVGRVSLDIDKSYPFLDLEIDSLLVIKRGPEGCAQWPVWADTLLEVRRLKGGINLTRLLQRQIVLNDVEIVSPRANLFILNDSVNNFSITHPSPEPAADTTYVPDIRIKSFSIVNPQPIRYVDAASDTHVRVMLEEASLEADPADLGSAPTYKVRFETDVESPLLRLFGLGELPIALNGTVDWRHDHPNRVGLEDFTFRVSALNGTMDAVAAFGEQIVVEKCDIAVHPLAVTQVLDIAWQSEARPRLTPLRGLSTDATVSASMSLTAPYVVGQTALPRALINICVPECRLAWQRLDLRRLALDLTAELSGDDIDDVTFDIQRFIAEGPAIQLQISGTIGHLATDPSFDGDVQAHLNVGQLPRALTDKIDGRLSGILTADAHARLRSTMFSRDNFHKLVLKGQINGRDLYFVTSDTLQMYYARNVRATFGTNESSSHTSRRTGRTITVDSLLSAHIDIDTMHMLASGLRMDLTDFSLGVSAQNNNASSDTTVIIPMGGRLRVGGFSMFTLSDSSGMRLRSLRGSVAMQRYRGDTHLPLFMVNANIERISAGDNHTRFMVSNSHLAGRIHRLPDSLMIPGRREVKRVADSLRRVHPDISIDSVYILASEIRRRNRRPGHRVHGQRAADDTEIIAWGTSNGMQRLLLDWDLRGTLTAERARLFTASFPLRNRVNNLNIVFSNDSIKLSNVEYKAGHSDFTLSGNIANIKRALTSRSGRQPLKLHFDLLSDTIDVNELAKAFFAGASHRKARLEGNLDDEDDLSRSLDLDKEESGPLLIPTNIDAEFAFRANNVSYSDLLLHNLQGTALMYDGALNLHDLRAASDVGDIDLSALYAAPTVKDMKFGFGLTLNDFNIAHFLKLVPAVDSLMPMIRNFSGIVTANMAATADVDSTMDLRLPTLNAVIRLHGDSLVVIDEKTYKTISKWLMFKDKNRNMIDSMSVEMTVRDGMMHMYPFVFNFDRYRLGIQGYNDLDMNFDYHIAVLKSPIPFKFGINIRGDLDHHKIRLGRARFNEQQAIERVAFADTTRVNLIRQFENVFRRGVRNSRFESLDLSRHPQAANIDLNVDTLTAADSLYLRQQGLIPD